MSLEFRIILPELRDPRMIAGIDDAIFESVSNGSSPPTLIFHKWHPSVTISAGQSVRDLNLDTCKEKGYIVLRMKSGGRAVVHHPETDFSYSLFIPFAHFDFDPRADPSRVYNIYCELIAKALKSAGLPTELRNKNDIYVGNKKLSGNAQNIRDRAVMQHGIILYRMPDPSLMLSLMNPVLYNGRSREELKEVLTAVDQYSIDGKTIGERDIVYAISSSLANGNSYKYGDITETESKMAKDFSKSYYTVNDNRGNVRGLCWLPRGAELGTYKGENPNA